MDLDLDLLLPRAIAWADSCESRITQSGKPLDEDGLALARSVGVSHPEQIRLEEVDEVPMPMDPMLQQASQRLGLISPATAGLTLGYAIFIKRGQNSQRLLSHEFRHVHQYEQAGSISKFMPVYIQQIIEHGYWNAPVEMDARSHEISD